jgi:outer membrane lipopolysaccharide assembly protein LptE/RlpB
MRALIIIALLVLLAGCGYHFPGKSGALPGDVQQLQIPLFANRTAKPQLENLLSSRVSEVFARNHKVTLVEQAAQAEAVLEGVIRSYSVTALSYNQNDDISEYRATLTVEANLRQVEDGRLLWSGVLSWDENYIADDDKGRQSDLENEAIDEIVLRLAEELLYRMLDDF